MHPFRAAPLGCRLTRPPLLQTDTSPVLLILLDENNPGCLKGFLNALKCVHHYPQFVGTALNSLNCSDPDSLRVAPAQFGSCQAALVPPVSVQARSLGPKIELDFISAL